MATTIGFWFPEQAGATLTAHLWSRTTPPVLINTGGDTATEPEPVDAPGYFEISVSESIPSGHYNVIVSASGDHLDSEPVFCDGTEGPFQTNNEISILSGQLAEQQRISWADIDYDPTFGDYAFVRVWLQNGNLRLLDIGALDAGATAEISVREKGTTPAAVLFTKSFTAADLISGAFESTVDEPGFVAGQPYVADIEITANGQTYTNSLPIGSGPA